MPRLDKFNYKVIVYDMLLDCCMYPSTIYERLDRLTECCKELEIIGENAQSQGLLFIIENLYDAIDSFKKCHIEFPHKEGLFEVLILCLFDFVENFGIKSIHGHIIKKICRTFCVFDIGVKWNSDDTIETIETDDY